MENIKKYITGIICCLLAVLVMSHNAGAVNYGSAAIYNISSAGANNGASYYGCYIVNGAAQCSSLNNQSGVIQSMSIIPNNTIPANSLISFDLSISNEGGAIQYYGFSPVRGYFYKVSENFEYSNTNMNLTSHIVLYTYQPVSEFGIDTSLATVYGNSWINISPLTVVALQGQVDNTSTLNNIARDTGLIKDKMDDITDAIENQNQEETDAVQDAADEAASEADENSTNQQTSNLIGVLQNFLTAITNFSGTNCNITLPFPSYAGGSMTVNVCQNKDKAGNIIGVFTSLTLIVFYLPLAIKLLSMIYNEIRSFTNG